MKLILNHRTEEFSVDKLTVKDLMRIKNFTFKMLIVKVNNSLIRKEDFDTTFLSDGDDVAIIHLISGG